MLFDLRSRRRRTVVRVIYLFLALVMVGGLLLVGVGTGSGGGILNALGGSNNGGSNSGQDAYLTQQLNKALAAVKAHPNSAADWGNLFSARWAVADRPGNVTSSNTLIKSALPDAQKAANAWQMYLKVSSDKPSDINAYTAARMYQDLAQYSDEASAWEYVIGATPASESDTLAKPYECLTASAYAAGDTATGSAAEGKAVKLAPKLDQITLKTDLDKAKTSTTIAKEIVTSLC